VLHQSAPWQQGHWELGYTDWSCTPLSDYARRNSTESETSSTGTSSETSTIEGANSFNDSSVLTDHVLAGGKLEVGDRGPEVEALQEMIGFNRPDGVFGPMTLKQLVLFQGAYNMVQSGVLDLQTYARLSQAMSSSTDINAVLFGQVGTGASRGTASQDRLPGGQNSSQTMAENDEANVLPHREKFETAAARYGIPAAILAAICSRETRGGSQLGEDGYSIYGGNQGFGLMQVDAGYHEPAGSATSLEHIEQAAGIFVGFRDQLRDRNPEWKEAQLLKAALSAYNCGPGRVRDANNMDGSTTGGDYSSDTWVRAQYYARYFNQTLPTS
jgi:peptidoglycan hydrolase-like protein with peptidoglycan-binding domain